MEDLYDYQKQIIDTTWAAPAKALFWEPRVGKTPPIIQTAVKLHFNNLIQAVVLIAPSPLHLNWSTIEVPAWAPNAKIFDWQSDVKEFPPLIKGTQLIFFCVNLEALQNPTLQAYLHDFVSFYPSMIVVDESHEVKSSRFKRTKTKKASKPRSRIVRELAQKCPYRRILTGTPTPQGPFDFWSQFYILDPMILGPSSTKFKAQYGNFENSYFGGQRVPTLNNQTPYKNLDELNAKIQPFISWMTLKQAQPHLPEILPLTQFFEMSPKVKKLYKELQEEFYTYINGKEVIVDHALTRLLRLQQLARGFFQNEVIDVSAPLEALDRALTPTKTVLWAHFKSELETLRDHFNNRPLIYIHEKTPPIERLILVDRFNQAPNPETILLSSPALTGQGLDMSGATNMIFYSNSYNLNDRIQASFRITGAKQKARQLFCTDIIATGSEDLKCLNALKNKQNMMESFRKL